MGTHITIDDDVARAAQKLAQEQNRSLDDVISDLVRRALPRSGRVEYRNGLPMLPISNPAAVVTLEHVNALRDEQP